MGKAVIVSVAVLGLTALVAAMGTPNFVSLLDNPKAKLGAQQVLARTLYDQVVRRALRNVGEPEPRIPLLPDYEDPYMLNETNVSFDVALPLPDLTAEICLDLNLTDVSTVRGLSSKVDNFRSIGISPVDFTWELGFPTKVNLSGPYNMAAYFNIDQEMIIFGEGNLFVEISDIFLDLFARVRTLGSNLEVMLLELDFGFSDLMFDGDEGTTGDGGAVDWQMFSDSLKGFIDAIWNEETKPAVTEMIRCALDYAVHNCTLAELIEGNTDCINSDIDPSCFEAESMDDVPQLQFNGKNYCNLTKSV